MEAVKTSKMPSKWIRFVGILLGIALATAVRFPVQQRIGHTSPFLFYFPVVLVTAVAFGFRAGLAATLISLLPANYFWMLPERTFSINFVQLCQMLAFAAAGISVSWLARALCIQRQVKEHLRATLSCVGDAIIATDCHGRIVFLNAMAQVLTELQGEEAIGRTVGDALHVVTAEGNRPLDSAFHIALNDDKIENLPKRVIVVSKTGRSHCVEQKISRLLDVRGNRRGLVILFHT
jgi:PAS domain S-box-containing protein